ncbi:MAG TPA: hypothetical protein PLS25_02340 [Methanoregulaceae archaeon]|nr:hypothetical protein [Methanoregulaceae archaeon]
MAKQSRYPLEVRERAVRLARANTREYGLEWSAMRRLSIGR